MKNLLKQLLFGALQALPFGNVLTVVADNVTSPEYSPEGEINYPKLIMYIITGLIVLARLFGWITNEDLILLIDNLQEIE
jgi:hypothetical protein